MWTGPPARGGRQREWRQDRGLRQCGHGSSNTVSGERARGLREADHPAESTSLSLAPSVVVDAPSEGPEGSSSERHASREPRDGSWRAPGTDPDASPLVGDVVRLLDAETGASSRLAREVCRVAAEADRRRLGDATGARHTHQWWAGRSRHTQARLTALGERSRTTWTPGPPEPLPRARCGRSSSGDRARHGLTDLANGRLLCPRPDRLAHDSQYAMTIHADNQVTFSRRT